MAGRRGTPIDVGDAVFNIAVAQDEKWVVSGTRSGLVTVWNAESYSKVTELTAHNDWVRAVNVSPDGTRIATGSEDETVCVWSVSGERLFGPLTHVHTVVVVKFSLADASSPLSRGTMRFGSMTVKTVTSSSSSLSKSTLL